MAKVTIEGHTFEGNVEELMDLFAKMGAKFPIEQVQETITHEGVEYKRVDREAREGDVVVFTEAPDDYVTAGKPYEIKRIDFEGDPVYLDNDGDTSYITHMTDEFDVYEPVVAKSAPLQVGDYAKVVEEPGVLSVGSIVKITDKDAKFFDFGVSDVISGEREAFDLGELTRATDEEVAEAKRQAAEKAVADKWAEIGRKPNEFKKGDIVRIVASDSAQPNGTLGEVGELDGKGGLRVLSPGFVKANWQGPDSVELITPVEHRFDTPAGDSE